MQFYTHGSAASFDHLGDFIRAQRQARGYTQRELAGVSGVGVRFLSELERGKPNVDLHLVLRVLETLGCELLAHDRSLPQPAIAPGPSGDHG